MMALPLLHDQRRSPARLEKVIRRRSDKPAGLTTHDVDRFPQGLARNIIRVHASRHQHGFRRVDSRRDLVGVFPLEIFRFRWNRKQAVIGTIDPATTGAWRHSWV
jgi:hypothetical protein